MQWIGVGIMVVSIIIALFSYSKDSGPEVSELAKWALPIGLIIMAVGNWLEKSQQEELNPILSGFFYFSYFDTF